MSLTLQPVSVERTDIAVGDTIQDTSYTITEYRLQLAPYQVVLLSLESDFEAWISLYTLDGQLIDVSGHANSGTRSGSLRYDVQADPEPIIVRISHAREYAADGSFTLSITERPVAMLDETLTLDALIAPQVIAADLEANTSYCLTLRTDADTDHRVTLNPRVRNVPALRLDGLQETKRGFTYEATRRVFFDVTYNDDNPIEVTIKLQPTHCQSN